MRTITISLIALILSTNVQAEVKSSEPLQPCLTKLGLHWSDWLLVELPTHRSMLKDGEGYRDSLKKLTAAQAKVIEIVEKVNTLQLEIHELKHTNYRNAVKIYELENPPWYKHPAFWAVSGVTAGVLLTAITAVSILIGTGAM